MNILNYKNGQHLKSNSKLGIISLTSSCIVIFMAAINLFLPNKFMLLQRNKVLFNALAVLQLLLIGNAIVFSLIDIQKKNSKKLLSIISLILISVLLLLTIKSLMYNNLLQS